MHSSHHTTRLRRVGVALVFCAALLTASLAGAADWTSFRGNDRSNAVTSARTPRLASETSLKWKLSLKDATDWSTNISDPLIIGDKLYVVVGKNLEIINKATGAISAKVALPSAGGYTTRPVAGDGTLFIPLAKGEICAVSLSDNKVLWTTPAITSVSSSGATQTHQAMTTPLYKNGKVYLSTAVADWSTSYRGKIVCVDASIETTDAASRIAWTYDNTDKGYYWSGLVSINGAIITAGDDGEAISLDAETGKVIDRKPLGSGVSVRTSIASYKSQAIFTTTEGRLVRLSVLSDGSFGRGAWSERFAKRSTTTPAITGDRAFVGGENLQSAPGARGVYAIIDLNTMDIVRSFNTENLSQSSALVSTAISTNPYAYFSMNNYPGGVYSISLKGTKPLTLFTPDEADQNYCMSSLIADSAGTMYYTNDSGTLFALAYKAPAPAPTPAPVVTKSNVATIYKVVKSYGSWKTRWSTSRLSPKYHYLLVGRYNSTIWLKPYKTSSKSRVYMRLAGQSYKKTDKLTLSIKRGQTRTVYVKCVSESGKVSKLYQIRVYRRK